MRVGLISIVALGLGIAGCGPAPTDQGTAPGQRGVQQERYERAPEREVFSSQGKAITAKDPNAARAEFLNRIRSADPDRRTIERALLNEQNELGVVLDRSVDMESIPSLMRSLLTQMAREFPGDDLTVIAYAPSDPPMKMGTGRLNARTRQMTYTPAR